MMATQVKGGILQQQTCMDYASGMRKTSYKVVLGSSNSAVYLRMLAGCQIFSGGLHAVQPVGLRTRLGVAAVWFSTVATACAVGAWRLDRSEPLLFLPWCTAPFISGIFVVLAATHGCRSHTERPVASQSLRDV